MEWRGDQGRQRYDAVVDVAAATVVCLDFDGVLSPIVADPAEAHIHPGAADALATLGGQVRAVAVVTGRPAAQAVSLGKLEATGRRILEQGGELLVLGQYGNERWSARTGRVETPPRPAGLDPLIAELPELLERARLTEVHVEHKSLAVALHTRRTADPHAALERLTPLLAEAAARHGLALEPGRMVIEVRAPGVHKGNAVRALHAELEPDGMVFAGDDLGDVQAFEAMAQLRDGGLAVLLVCSGSEEQRALVELADVVVDGPDDVMELLTRLAGDASAAR